MFYHIPCQNRRLSQNRPHVVSDKSKPKYLFCGYDYEIPEKVSIKIGTSEVYGGDRQPVPSASQPSTSFASQDTSASTSEMDDIFDEDSLFSMLIEQLCYKVE